MVEWSFVDGPLLLWELERVSDSLLFYSLESFFARISVFCSAPFDCLSVILTDSLNIVFVVSFRRFSSAGCCLLQLKSASDTTEREMCWTWKTAKGRCGTGRLTVRRVRR
jgi:hypothetical protein